MMTRVPWLLLGWLTLTLRPTFQVEASTMYYGLNEEALENLARKEFGLVEKIWEKEQNLTLAPEQDKYPKKLQKRISKYLEDIYLGIPSETEEALKDKEIFLRREPLSESWINKTIFEIATNPLSSLRMILRIREKIPRISKQTTKIWGLNLTELLPKILPDMEDEQTVILAIVNGQLVYNFPASELAKGNFPNGISTGVTLSAIHCYIIGLFAVEYKMFALAVDWLYQAYKRKEDKALKDTSIELADVVSELEETINSHNMILASTTLEQRQIQFPSGEFFDQPIASSFSLNYKEALSEIHAKMQQYYQHSLKRIEERISSMPKSAVGRESWEDHEKREFFQYVCSGKNFMSEQQKSKLFCWYESKKNLFYLIGPMKMEFLAMDPDLVRIYDVIGPQGIQRIQRQAAGKYRRAVARQTLKDKFVTNNDSYAKPGMDVSPLFAGIELGSIWVHNRYVAKLVSPGEHSPVTTISLFTFGGQFKPHVHDLQGEQYHKNPRGGSQHFALTYMSNVKVGGHTGFPIVGVTVEPIAGSTLIWYDLRSDGSHDPQMYHGGCPVFLGKKFTNNRNDMYFDQFLHYKCSLKQGERFKNLVNGKEPW